MAQSKKITVWNASKHLLKVGQRRIILHPGTSLFIERDAYMDALLESGKLVIIEEVSFAPVAEESSKKKKKEVVDSLTEEETQDVQNTESAEDSILPKEVE